MRQQQRARKRVRWPARMRPLRRWQAATARQMATTQRRRQRGLPSGKLWRYGDERCSDGCAEHLLLTRAELCWAALWGVARRPTLLVCCVQGSYLSVAVL